MAFQALSVLTIILNNVQEDVVPNSVMFDQGEGEITVRAASGGGNQSVSVHTPNAETKLGRVHFKLYTNARTSSLVPRLKKRVGTNNVSAVQRNDDGTSVTLSWANLSVVNNVEHNPTHDGDVAIEMTGDPMTSI